ncbi:uncharacterized protein N7515_007961 [Penicillium bovifimosum]|uniref:Uncharacterized protein n=1 Tax=Penicillium bovifimosum TaxID=126998 RepID=A0A9W9KXA1_9EURO|nr:uncharacterized protein N7515_007961 [Penicillium bovifimosum]KAJ5124136.1 hypothetical protein N7515_007961 [Penicillium bovifimosum]
MIGELFVPTGVRDTEGTHPYLPFTANGSSGPLSYIEDDDPLPAEDTDSTPTQGTILPSGGHDSEDRDIDEDCDGVPSREDILLAIEEALLDEEPQDPSLDYTSGLIEPTTTPPVTLPGSSVTEQELEASSTVTLEQAVQDAGTSSMAPPERPITSISDSIVMPPPRYPASGNQTGSDFEVAKIRRCTRKMTQFHFNIAVWCITAGISRTQYKSFCEAIKCLEASAAEEPLPRDLSALKRTMYGQINTLEMLCCKIPVITTKLPTLSEQDRRLAESVTRTLYLINPIPMVIRLLQSPAFRKLMHKGLARSVQSPTELWESDAWTSSIRSTSGKFATYPDGKPIFPSDIVYYQCNASCCLQFGAPGHIGRVYSVSECQAKDSDMWKCVIHIQPVLQRQEVHVEDERTIIASGPGLAPHELILLTDRRYTISPRKVLRQEESVYLDRQFELEDDILAERTSERAAKSSAKSSAKASAKSTLPKGRQRFVLKHPDYKFTICRAIKSDMQVYALKNTNPIRGELEIWHYGREHLVETLFRQRCISFPMQIFCDGFRLKRTIQDSLMGIYMIPSFIPAKEREKRANLFTLTLGPHGTNYTDVTRCLMNINELERGIEVDWVDGKKMRVVAFCLSYIGDMPQQQLNAGFKGPTATYSCRKCFVRDDQRGDLDFNIVKHGRYHFECLAQRKQAIAHRIRGNKTVQREYLQNTGMLEQASPISRLSPELDLVTGFPSDPAHSEYKGLSYLVQKLLIEDILSPVGREEFAAALYRFPTPPGWTRLQSPLHHLESYQIQEHARASIIFPLLLRQRIKKKWIKDSVYESIRRTFGVVQYQPEERVVTVFAAIAKSNSLLAYHTIPEEDRQSFNKIITDARSAFQSLCTAVIKASRGPRRSRNSSRAARSSSTSRERSPTAQTDDPGTTQKADFWGLAMKRPNVHTALHYSLDASMYATPWNSNVLAGEDKHR